MHDSLNSLFVTYKLRCFIKLRSEVYSRCIPQLTMTITVKTNPLMFNINGFRIKTKSKYSFEDRGADRRTDRQNRFQNVHSKTFQMIYDTPTKFEN